jgi:hypothetical protein
MLVLFINPTKKVQNPYISWGLRYVLYLSVRNCGYSHYGPACGYYCFQACRTECVKWGIIFGEYVRVIELAGK